MWRPHRDGLDCNCQRPTVLNVDGHAERPALVRDIVLADLAAEIVHDPYVGRLAHAGEAADGKAPRSKRLVGARCGPRRDRSRGDGASGHGHPPPDPPKTANVAGRATTIGDCDTGLSDGHFGLPCRSRRFAILAAGLPPTTTVIVGRKFPGGDQDFLARLGATLGGSSGCFG